MAQSSIVIAKTTKIIGKVFEKVFSAVFISYLNSRNYCNALTYFLNLRDLVFWAYIFKNLKDSFFDFINLVVFFQKPSFWNLMNIVAISALFQNLRKIIYPSILIPGNPRGFDQIHPRGTAYWT